MIVAAYQHLSVSCHWTIVYLP